MDSGLVSCLPLGEDSTTARLLGGMPDPLVDKLRRSIQGRMRRRLPLLVALVLVLGGSSARALRMPAAPRCPVFPKSSRGTSGSTSFRSLSNSDEIVRSIGAGGSVHADLGSGLWEGAPIGIPITVVGNRQPKKRVSFEFADESDRGPYPIPRNVKSRAGAPRPATGTRSRRPLVPAVRALRLYPKGNGWRAGSGAIWNLRSNKLRPAGWTSADAAGLPILPGLARYDEVERGVIDHALRFTVQRTRRAYVFPARHYASNSDDPSLPPMGLRLRLKASFDVSGFPRQARIVLDRAQALRDARLRQRLDWYVTGAPDPRWSNDQLHALAACGAPTSRSSAVKKSVRRPARKVESVRQGTVVITERRPGS